MVSGKLMQEPRLGDGNVKADREAVLHCLSCSVLTGAWQWLLKHNWYLSTSWYLYNLNVVWKEFCFHSEVFRGEFLCSESAYGEVKLSEESQGFFSLLPLPVCDIHCLVRECLSLQVSSCKFLGPLAIIKYLFLSYIFGSFTGSCVWKWQLKLGLLKCEQISNINSKAILHEILKVYMMSLGLDAQILYFISPEFHQSAQTYESR